MRNEPRPQCSECGRVLHPSGAFTIVSEGGPVTDELPDAMPIHPDHPDVFTGLYCGSNCVLDAMHRGWPEYRTTLDDDLPN